MCCGGTQQNGQTQRWSLFVIHKIEIIKLFISYLIDNIKTKNNFVNLIFEEVYLISYFSKTS